MQLGAVDVIGARYVDELDLRFVLVVPALHHRLEPVGLGLDGAAWTIEIPELQLRGLRPTPAHEDIWHGERAGRCAGDLQRAPPRDAPVDERGSVVRAGRLNDVGSIARKRHVALLLDSNRMTERTEPRHPDRRLTMRIGQWGPSELGKM